MGKAMGDGNDLSIALREARTISAAWGRRLPWYRDEFASACNLAIAQALKVDRSSSENFDGLCRCIMHRRCRDVYRDKVRNRGRSRPLFLRWAEDWHDSDRAIDYATTGAVHFRELALDPWEPDDTPYLMGLVLGYVDEVSRLGLVKPRSVTALRLWLELGDQVLAGERLGVSDSRISQMVAEVIRAIKTLKVTV